VRASLEVESKQVDARTRSGDRGCRYTFCGSRLEELRLARQVALTVHRKRGNACQNQPTGRGNRPIGDRYRSVEDFGDFSGLGQ
jgi:hypothetical protein